MSSNTAENAIRNSPQPHTSVDVQLNAVRHRFQEQYAVDDINLHIRPGELIALLGPSGCGKTTLLRIVAGLLKQTSGSVNISGQAVDSLPPNERGAGIVFQSYALFPHMTVQANIAYGLKARGVDNDTCNKVVAKMLDLVRMTEFAKRMPRELSGGQQQRIALARTLAVNPKILLLDEPFAALDKNLRLDMQIEIRRIQKALGITCVMVTHDQEEALSMADRVAVMNQGKVEQFDRPEAIYDNPATLFVAQFVGTANLIRGRLSRVTSHLSDLEQRWHLRTPSGALLKLELPQPCTREGAVVLAARPEHLEIGEPGPDAITAQVNMVLPLGPSLIYELKVSGANDIKVTVQRDGAHKRYNIDDTVGLRLRVGAPTAVFQDIVEAQ
jgi:putative spermidine/putrescine transport system ATP-binding protein